jgi:serine/threonine protein kinase
LFVAKYLVAKVDEKSVVELSLRMRFVNFRYPFHGQEHTGLFAKIRRGHFSLPDTLSSRAKCLIRCLLRKEPEERLNTEDVLIHPWMTQLRWRLDDSPYPDK